VQDTTGFAGFKNQLVSLNLSAVNALPVVDKDKIQQQVEDACVKASYKEIDSKQFALRYDYTKANLIFMIFGVLAFLVAFLLKAEDKKKGYGLELPNMKK
jgi:hypothetical protein